MRLTYKYEDSNDYGSVALKNLPPDPLVNKLSYLDNAWQEERNKLGQLEDIEERLGIDLITFLQGIDPDTCRMEITKENKFYFSVDSYYGEYNTKRLLELIQNLLFMYHKLKEKEQ